MTVKCRQKTIKVMACNLYSNQKIKKKCLNMIKVVGSILRSVDQRGVESELLNQFSAFG